MASTLLISPEKAFHRVSKVITFRDRKEQILQSFVDYDVILSFKRMKFLEVGRSDPDFRLSMEPLYDVTKCKLERLSSLMTSP